VLARTETAEQAIHLILCPPHVPEQIRQRPSTAYSLNIVRLLTGWTRALASLHRTSRMARSRVLAIMPKVPRPDIDARQFAEGDEELYFLAGLSCNRAMP
jgi:hypothetical protein